MPTFTAIALERLLEPGSRNPSPKPPPASDTSANDTARRPNISPALYATPDSTPLPDSPSSFSSESPYLINHKRRGPCLIKKNLQVNDAVGGQPKPSEAAEKVEPAKETEEHNADDEHRSSGGSSTDKFTVGNGQSANLDRRVIGVEELAKPVSSDYGDTDDFFDMQSLASNSDVDDSSSQFKVNTSVGNYYDALEEISSDGTPRSSFRDLEDELYEMKLNLLTEMQRRKHAEESLEKLQSLWQSLSHHLSLLGLSIPLPSAVSESMDMQLNLDPAEELAQQVVVSRFVAEAIGRGCARAEIELEMEPQIASKNSQIARLSDRLQYYEAANREMSQRNQEGIEMARQQRNRHKRRQKWFWSSVCLAITIGAAAIAWSYHPLSKPTLTEVDDAATGHEDA